MAKCDVQVELDRNDPVYTSDEAVRGRAVVDVEEDVECESLVLKRIWQARALGDERSGVETVETLFSGRWRGGNTYEYSFEAPLPPGPYSYDGEELAVAWMLRARANIGIFDAWGDAEFDLEPGSPDEYDIGDEDAFREAREEGGATVSWGWVALGAMVLAVGIILPVGSWYEGNLDAALLAGFLALDALGLGLVYKGTRTYWVGKRLGDIRVLVSPREAAPGDEVTCRVRLPEEAEGTLTGLRMELACHEVAGRAGSREREIVTELHSESVVPDGSRGLELKQGRAEEFSAGFRVPDPAPPSFYSSHSRVAWTVAVGIAPRTGAEWSREKHLLVRPAPRGTGDRRDAAG